MQEHNLEDTRMILSSFNDETLMIEWLNLIRNYSGTFWIKKWQIKNISDKRHRDIVNEVVNISNALTFWFYWNTGN